jgi:EAL domain-containing protein (putative c-di-GMP-specific phosphodiesterase class I)
MAEESGFIVPLGEWVLREACAQLEIWRSQGLQDCTLAVNLSPKQFASEGLFKTISALIEQTEIMPAQLHLEITESILMSHSEAINTNFDELGCLGIRFSIDDFGTGYSSLAYLKRFPPDILKIDRSFVQDLPGNSGNVAIVTAVIAMAKSLGIAVIAEGVETDAQLAFLKYHGCEQAQGFLFCHAVSATEFMKIALERRNMCAVA